MICSALLSNKAIGHEKLKLKTNYEKEKKVKSAINSSVFIQ